MIVFVDESGDAGLKVESGSSPHFVVTLVVFNDNDEATRVDEHLSEVRKKLNFRTDFEFHFHKLSKNYRKHLLREVAQFDFIYFSIVFLKTEIEEFEIKSGKQFYHFAYTEACLVAKEFLENATIIVDGQGSREFKQRLEKVLKSGLNLDLPPKIKKVKMQDSHKNNLLQLADIICGSVAKFYTKNEVGGENYREIIKSREGIVEIYTKKKV
jgi:Protein of unknown function (DUF3800)